MNRIKTLLKNRMNYLQSVEKELEMRLKSSPSGTLRISRSAGRIQYYHRRSFSDRKGKYIRKQEKSLAVHLAQKQYDEAVLKTLKSELNAIAAYFDITPEHEAEGLYERLNECRKELVEPAFETDTAFAEKWVSRQYSGKEFSSNYPVLITSKGVRVRSKSELLIANMLELAGVPYRYECPLELKGLGTVYPDFMVLNVRLRKEFVWEHLGMMDDKEYAEKAVCKIAAYNRNGFCSGDRLILTAETLQQPVDGRQISGIIEHCLK